MKALIFPYCRVRRGMGYHFPYAYLNKSVRDNFFGTASRQTYAVFNHISVQVFFK